MTGHSGLSRGDLVFRGRQRVSEGRSLLQRDIQDFVLKKQQRFEIGPKSGTRQLDQLDEDTLIQEWFTRSQDAFGPYVGTDGTGVFKHPRSEHPARASGGPLDFQAPVLDPSQSEAYRARQTGLPGKTHLLNELLERYRGRTRGGLTRSDIGVITEIMEGRGEHDEPHVKVLLANGTEEIWDRDAVNYAGKLKPQKGNVIVKWQGARPEGVSEHQEWPMFALTELRFALVRDPWGNPHCLPPRDAAGDVKYEFQHLDVRYVISMQTICYTLSRTNDCNWRNSSKGLGS